MRKDLLVIGVAKRGKGRSRGWGVWGGEGGGGGAVS